MRLLNTTSLELQDFFGDKTPRYAILSHTWGEGEVLFDDIRSKTASSKKGYAKITGCCKKALDDGFHWVWIDTCCIDKSSSAELSEAINSMYRWYHASAVCYAYLSDVAAGEHARIPSLLPVREFASSRWFTRGWTLQELIAPRIVEFYTSEWIEIGTKTSLSKCLAVVTHIKDSVLRGDNPTTCTVAERMHWASRRETTREEDMAYCLMGLFDVTMPLLYGEGSKAFVRLQEQVLRQEEDYSIFAWTQRTRWDDDPALGSGVLAPAPSDFIGGSPHNDRPPPILRASHYILRPPDEAADQPLLIWTSSPDYSRMHQFRASPVLGQEPTLITNRGIRISLPALVSKETYIPTLVWLFCSERDDRGECYMFCLALRRTHMRSEDARDHTRRFSPWLIKVHHSLEIHFEMTDMFWHTTGTLQIPGLRFVPNLSPISLQTQQVHVKMDPNIDWLISIGSAWPPSWPRGTSFIFDLRGSVTGCLALECESIVERDKKIAKFQVMFGCHLGLWWCKASRFHAATARDHFLTNFGFTEKQLSIFFAEVSDRSVVYSASDKVVFHAAIRSHKDPTNPSLHLGLCRWGDTLPWMAMIAGVQG